MDELIVVGDIHGDLARLERMLGLISEIDRRIVFLGDYVNRGDQSSAVVERLLCARRGAPTKFTFLMGNHELSLVKFLEGDDFVSFASIGGMPTIRSYVGSNVYDSVREALSRHMPEQHRAFFETLDLYWESDDVLISHIGYDPQAPGDRSVASMVSQAHPEIFCDPNPPVALTVCGHYVQSSGRPYISKHLICIDTGCGTRNGP
jgi:serine/threonine protein phosphatase 1